MVAEQVSAQWVMEARRSGLVEGVCQEDVIQPTDGVETGSDVVPSENEQPLSSSIEPSADATGWPQ